MDRTRASEARSVGSIPAGGTTGRFSLRDSFGRVMPGYRKKKLMQLTIALHINTSFFCNQRNI